MRQNISAFSKGSNFYFQHLCLLNIYISDSLIWQLRHFFSYCYLNKNIQPICSPRKGLATVYSNKGSRKPSVSQGILGNSVCFRYLWSLSFKLAEWQRPPHKQERHPRFKHGIHKWDKPEDRRRDDFQVCQYATVSIFSTFFLSMPL